jgi:hypothetical protein
LNNYCSFEEVFWKFAYSVIKPAEKCENSVTYFPDSTFSPIRKYNYFATEIKVKIENIQKKLNEFDQNNKTELINPILIEELRKKFHFIQTFQS